MKPTVTSAIKSGLVWGAITLAAVVSAPKYALADEGGVSFWIPGFFGSLAATPQQPGWSVANIDYYTNVSAGGGVALAKEFQIKNLPFNIQAQINANVHATGAINFVIPSYVFATPVLGGQLSLSALEGYGRATHLPCRERYRARSRDRSATRCRSVRGSTPSTVRCGVSRILSQSRN